MINWITTLRIIAVFALLALFAIKFYLTITIKIPRGPEYKKIRVLRTGAYWTSIYVFFLAVLSILSLLQIGTLEARQVASAAGAIIPLIAVLIHMFLDRKIDKDEVV